MDDRYCLLPERISEQFSEIDSDIVMDLAAASPEYTELEGPEGRTETPKSCDRRSAGGQGRTFLYC